MLSNRKMCKTNSRRKVPGSAAPAFSNLTHTRYHCESGRFLTWKGSNIFYFNFFFPKCFQNFDILIQELDFHLSKIDPG